MFLLLFPKYRCSNCSVAYIIKINYKTQKTNFSSPLLVVKHVWHVLIFYKINYKINYKILISRFRLLSSITPLFYLKLLSLSQTFTLLSQFHPLIFSSFCKFLQPPISSSFHSRQNQVFFFNFFAQPKILSRLTMYFFFHFNHVSFVI